MPALAALPRVGDLAEVGEIVLVHLVEERDEFLVVVEDVPLLLLRRPVDVDLIGVVRPVGAVLLGGALQPASFVPFGMRNSSRTYSHFSHSGRRSRQLLMRLAMCRLMSMMYCVSL